MRKQVETTNFSSNVKAVTKWTLNRVLQAEVMSEFRLFVGIDKAHASYKDLQPAQNIKSEINTTKTTI